MADQTEICNLALGHLGQRPIASIDDATESARKLKLFWESTRDGVLRSASWNFATKIEPLALLANETIPGWSYLYVYPPKCLYVRKIVDSTNIGSLPTEQTTDTKQINEFRQIISPTTGVKALAANIEDAWVEYTYQVTDPSLYDSLFVEAFSYKLAAQLAQPLTGDLNLRERCLAVYKAMIEEAKLTNASESLVKPKTTSSYVDSR